jgi:hypothetical protein
MAPQGREEIRVPTIWRGRHVNQQSRWEQWQSRAGLGNSPRTVLEEIAAIHSTDVVLPTATARPRDLRLRWVVRPDRAQAASLDRLGLRLPERLRRGKGCLRSQSADGLRARGPEGHEGLHAAETHG